MLKKSSLPFWFCLLFLVLFRGNDLSLPYHWDELGVYSNIIHEMVDSSPSMIPGEISDDASRGHPLFFGFLYSSVYSNFGVTPETGHILSLTLSLLLLILTFFFGKKWFGENVAGIAVIVFTFQGLFITQSIMVLPEILLSVLLLLGLGSWIGRRYFMFMVASSLAIMTKETGIILPSSILLFEFWKIIFEREKIEIKRFLIALFPILIFAVFLIYQKIEVGYFFYPYHTSLMSWNPIDMSIRVFQSLHGLFFFQGRFIILIFLILIFRENGFSIKPFHSNLQFFSNKKTIQLHFSFLIVGLAFFSINYYMDRYLLIFFPLLSIYAAKIILYYFQNRKKQFVFIFPIIILTFIFFWYQNLWMTVESDLRYKEVVSISQQAVEFVEKNNMDDLIISGNFPIISCLEDQRDGYLKNNLKLNLIQNYSPKSDWYLHFYFKSKIEEEIFDLPKNLELITHFEDKHCGIKVLKIMENK